MKYTLFNYRMTNKQLFALTHWPKLAEEQPEVGRIIEAHLLAEKFHDHVVGAWVGAGSLINGLLEHTGTYGIKTDKGIFVSDPSKTYWRYKE